MSATDYGPQRVEAKDPTDVLDYAFAFDGEGFATSEAITGAPTVVVDPIPGDPTPLVVGSITLSGSPARTVNVFFTGGTAGNEYRVTITFSTNQSRTFQRSFLIPVMNR